MTQANTATKTKLIDVSNLPPEDAINKLVEYALNMPASDIFFVTNEQHVAVNVRYLGIVQPLAIVGADTGKRYIQSIKANAGMDMGETRRPLDGRWLYEPDEGESVDMRVNMIPTMYGQDLALRVLPRKQQMLAIEQIGMSHDQIQSLQQMIESPSGLILITGPTGAGKTATLYSCLSKLNNGKLKINTIEDPIEYAVEGLRQSQVNPILKLNFADLLRAVLRQSPDIIMVGEVRDQETAETAVRAANSGHLVFATLHAPTAAGAVQSMRSLGIHPHFLSTSLHGVVAQRLVRTLCSKCKTRFDLDEAPHTFDEIRPWLGQDEGKYLYAAPGCEACFYSGYAGRTGIFEVMHINRDIRTMIADGLPTRDIRARALEQKMLEFRHSAMLKVAQGITSTEEVIRVIPPEHLLLDD